VVLEACAAGLPVIATNVGGTSEIVENGVNGYLVASGDPSALANRLLELVRSAERRHEMGARGRELVRARFSFERQAQEYERLFALVARGATRRELARAEAASVAATGQFR
jgi:glycosyltransferase involved in cell wall biosynthesis